MESVFNALQKTHRVVESICLRHRLAEDLRRLRPGESDSSGFVILG